MFKVFIALPIANMPRKAILDAVDRHAIPVWDQVERMYKLRDRQIDFIGTYYDESSTIPIKDRITCTLSMLEDADAVYFLEEFMSDLHYRLLKDHAEAMNKQILYEPSHFYTHKENSL